MRALLICLLFFIFYHIFYTDKSKGVYDDEKHVQFAHISLVHLLIINKDDKSMLN